jgi:hypothetical protein
MRARAWFQQPFLNPKCDFLVSKFAVKSNLYRYITVGNHFYKDTKAPDGSGKPSKWILLKMTRATLEAKKIDLKFEWPSPVGATVEMDAAQSGGERFPHIFGGIPTEGVVVQDFDITRADDGEFTGVVGL